MSEGAPAWMATFADLMSLLLTFFVLLLSFSTPEENKFMGMVGSVRFAFGVQKDKPGNFVGMTNDMIQISDNVQKDRQIFETLALSLRKAAATRGVNDAGVQISVGKEGVRMRIPGELLFDGGESAISPRAFPFLDDIASRARSGGWQLDVEGHSDQAGAGGSEFSSVWRLSSDRAVATVEYLVEAGRVPRNQLGTTAFADTRPLGDNATAEGRRQNRRVEVLFKPPVPTAR